MHSSPRPVTVSCVGTKDASPLPLEATGWVGGWDPRGPSLLVGAGPLRPLDGLGGQAQHALGVAAKDGISSHGVRARRRHGGPLFLQ
jgi:hypothetical protein